MILEVRRDDLRRTRVVEEDPGGGPVRLRVVRFALTANNVTYGAFGDDLDYWRFFPAAEEGWGRVPVWGYADVVASGVEGVAPGARYYGYFPMASEVAFQVAPGGPGFMETSPHRADLPATYNRYLRVDPRDPHADAQLLLRPLFGTALVLAAHLRDLGAQRVAVSSASSKTAYSTAFLLAGVPVTGLTSARNREFAASLGVYDEVRTYDEVEGLGADVFVDFAGSPEVRAAVHEAAELRHSLTVGATRWEGASFAGEGLPGPAPEFFFAPTHIEQRMAELGPPAFMAMWGEAWARFAAELPRFMTVEVGEGPDAARDVWLALVEGTADPRRGHILTLG